MTSSPAHICETTPNNLVTLARWMAGDFSNYQQAFENSKDYAHIHVFFSAITL
ncbi:CpcT/CpeT family chromophore lyase [Nostoc sp. UHCC 0870]|uniref:CpcT/CpeT family chromophore lyase n=1 Tax=Nostoc sp. UHCC 0870 TaxID=2914041 RepID=UPI003FA53D50